MNENSEFVVSFVRRCRRAGNVGPGTDRRFVDRRRAASVAGCQRTTPFGKAAEAEAQTSVAEIIVTAQKRAESLQQVPVAITAITSAGLEQRGITGLANFQTT